MRVYLVVLLMCSSCAMMPTKAKFQRRMDTWNDQNISAVIAKIGIPNKTMQIDAQHKAYEYVFNSGSETNTTYDANVNELNSSTNAQYCRVTFFTDNAGLIDRSISEGPTCRSR